MSYNPKISNTKDNKISISGTVYVGGTLSGNINFDIDSLEVSSVNSNTLNVLTGFELDSKPKTSVKVVSVDTTLTSNDNIVLINASNGNKNIFLPSVIGAGQELIIKKNDTSANNINIGLSSTELAVLSGSKAIQSSDSFGYSVAINSAGNIAVIGAYADESGSTAGTGLGYIFNSSSNGWREEAALSGSKAIDLGDSLGISVAINSIGNTVVIGAYNDESGSTSATGLVYVFSSSSVGWTETAILSGSKAVDANDRFGYSVSVNGTGDLIVVGAHYDEAAAATNSGLAYVFKSGSNGWMATNILSGSKATQASDFFGYSVSVNSAGNCIVVGAYADEPSVTTDVGLVYVFNSGSSDWKETAVLSGSKAIETGDSFGISVDVNSSGDIIIVGAYGDEPSTTLSTGLAYIFTSSSNGWKESAVLSGSKAVDASDRFGCSVAINSIGDVVIVGAYADEPSSTADVGLAYIFKSGTTGWLETNILSGSKATQGSDNFGGSVDIDTSGSIFLIGAYLDEPTGLSNTGVSYIFNCPNKKIDNNSLYFLTSAYEKVKLIYDGDNWIKI